MQLDSIEDYMDFPSHNLDMEKGMLGNVMNQQEEDNDIDNQLPDSDLDQDVQKRNQPGRDYSNGNGLVKLWFLMQKK